MIIPTLALALVLQVVAETTKKPQHRRALRADTDTIGLRSRIAIATYDEALGIPKCGLESSSCDTGDLVIGRGNINPEPNHPNTLDTTCLDGISGGPSDESVDRIVVSSESGGYLMEEGRALITATVNCWADGYLDDYIYFYYSNIQSANAAWIFIERIQCTGGGQQTLNTSYTLPQGLDHAVRVSIRHLNENELTSNDGSCGVGTFDDNDDVAFRVASSTLDKSFAPTAALPVSSTSSPSFSPSAMQETNQPTMSNNTSISSIPSFQPTLSESKSRAPTFPPTMAPSMSRTHTYKPSIAPSDTKTESLSPTTPPFVLFNYGKAFYTDTDLGIQVSVGLTVRRIAKSGTSVSFANGNQSSIPYHSMMDGAGISLLPDGGYVYMSNAEVEKGGGGVYGLYFNKEREITDYKALLTGTSRNCGGGMSPWNTWISCEEVDNGQCWQVDPNPDSPYHSSPNATLLGGPNGGAYETVAVDNTDEDKPVFFTTEDKSNGELRRFEADGNGWDALHEGGQTTYLEFLDGNRFQWTSDLDAGMNSAANHYPNAEGIIYHNSTLYFVAKVTRTLFILDLEDMTYTSERTGSSFVGQGSFNSQPDQIIESDLDTRKYVYFTEDGGNKPGIHVRDRDGNYYTMLRGVPDGRYKGDETVGIAFSPDRRAFYFGFQDAGVLMEVTRDDGHAFN